MKLAEVANQSTAESRRKALNAFLSYLGASHPKISELDDALLDGWVIWMIQNGYTRNTTAQYLKQLSALYSKAVADCLAPPSDAIGRARSRLLQIPETDFNPLPADILSRLQKLFRQTAEPLPPSLQLSKDIVVFALLNGGMTFKQIAKYRKTDYKGDNPILQEIVSRNIRARNKYLFNLNQAERTSKQLASDLRKHFFLILTPLGINLTEEPAFDLWCYIALQSGLSPQRLIAYTNGALPTFNPALRLLSTHLPPSAQPAEETHPTAHTTQSLSPVLQPTENKLSASADNKASGLAENKAGESADNKVSGSVENKASGSAENKVIGSVENRVEGNEVDRIPETELTTEERTKIINKVADILTDNPLNWYAMQFRPFVDFDKVKAAMDACANEVRFNTIYYPSEEIRKRVGKKLLKEQRPVMPGLLFFRARVTDVLPMFRHIGHLAWCYRRTATPGSPYAIISPSEMRRYQTIIGQFTPDIEVHEQGTIEVSENDTVILLTGNLAGREATVLSVKPKPDGKTIIRLSFIGDNNIEWHLTANPSQITPKP